MEYGNVSARPRAAHSFGDASRRCSLVYMTAPDQYGSQTGSWSFASRHSKTWPEVRILSPKACRCFFRLGHARTRSLIGSRVRPRLISECVPLRCRAWAVGCGPLFPQRLGTHPTPCGGSWGCLGAYKVAQCTFTLPIRGLEVVFASTQSTPVVQGMYVL